MSNNVELANKINNLDSIVFKVINKIVDRADIGFKKYKTNMDRKDLTIIQWIDHSIEEKMDDIIYMEKIKKELIDNNISNITYHNNKDYDFDNDYKNDLTKYFIYMILFMPLYIDLFYKLFIS
jgi:hypothetical protein